MKKIFLVLIMPFFISNAFALSCMPLETPPPITESIENYKTIGVLEIIDFQTEDFIEGEHYSTDGQPRKYTIHTVKWKSLKKGHQGSEIFSLRINSTAWDEYVSKFEPGTLLPLTTNFVMEDDLLSLDQDLGCDSNDWAMYSVEDIESLNEVKQPIEKKSTPEIPEKVESFWEKMLSWFSKVFKN